MTELGEFATLQVEVDNGVARAVISNPPINLMTIDLYRDLMRLPDVVAAEPSARALVLASANPDFFIAHFDVETILTFPADTPTAWTDELNPFHRMCERYRTMPIPTICEIAGRVGGGGGELAASCDMRFGAIDTTVLCQMEVPLGILPGGTGTQRLPQLVGRGRAMEIVLAGDDIDAATLEQWGWLNRAVPAAELTTHVNRLAARIASFPPEAVSRAKASVLAAEADPVPGMRVEAHLFQETVRTDAAQQRMRNFLDRGGQTVDGESRVGALGAELG
ncbi:MAG: enoyl-CoA hydratase/isomerase family protein [Actinomycetota bacterium]